MKKIIIVGNSPVAVKAVEFIRSVEPDIEVVQFSFEQVLPYRKYCLPDWISTDITNDELSWQSQEYYQGLPITRISDKKLIRINCRKNYVVTEDKEKFSYDFLVLADTGTDQFSDIKGNNKIGVYNLRRHADINELVQNLHMIETVIIQSPDILGLRIASALQKKGKEVVFVMGNEGQIHSFIDEESWVVAKKALEGKGIRFVDDNAIETIFGENDAKAVKLRSGKVFSAQAIILGESGPDLRLLKGSGIEYQDRVAVNSAYQTNVSNVFALNEICDAENLQYKPDFSNYRIDEFYIDKIAQKVSDAIVGKGDAGAQSDDFPQQPPIKTATVLIDDVRIDWVGCTQTGSGIRQSCECAEEEIRLKKKFIEGGHAVGAILVNCPDDRDRMIEMVNTQEVVALEPQGNSLNNAGLAEETSYNLSQETVPETEGSLEVIKHESAGD